MNKYIEFMVQHRKKLLISLVIINLLAIVGIFQIKINAEFDIFQINDSKYLEELEKMEEVFGNNNQTLMLVKADGLENTIDSVDGILENKVEFTSPNLMLQMSGQEDFSALGNLSPIVEREEGTYVTYRLVTDATFDFGPIIQALEKENLTFYFSGDAYMQYEIIHLIMKVLIRIPPLALLLVLLTFRSQLSSFKAAFLSVLPAGLSALWTMGLVGWFGGEVSIITVLAPIFAIVIGSADGLHFVTHLEEEFYKGKSHVASVIHTLGIVGVPMIITTTTSIAGFMGLTMIDNAAIHGLAIFASIGVLLAGVATWYVLPLLFVGDIPLKYSKQKQRNNWLYKLWGKKSILITLILILSSLVFIPNIQTEFNQLLFFRSHTTVQKNFEKIIEINGGAIPVYLTGAIPLEEREAYMGKMGTYLDTLEDNDHIAKIINPLGMMVGTPNLQTLAAAKDFVRLDGNQLYYRFLIFPKDLSNETIQGLEDSISNNPVDAKMTGVQFLLKEMNASIVESQVLSIVMTIILIIIMLLLSLKSLKLTLTAILPIVLTSVTLYGFLGLTGISLNLMTCTIFSITLGIGVDYAIHYTSVYKYYLDRGHATPREEAFRYTSRPVIANAFGLSLGMTALWLSPLLIHLHISSLMWVSMTIAVFMSLTLLPTLLKKN